MEEGRTILWVPLGEKQGVFIYINHLEGFLGIVHHPGLQDEVLKVSLYLFFREPLRFAGEGK